MRAITVDTSLVTENIRGPALASIVLPFLAPSCLRESLLSGRCHFYSDVPLGKKHIPRANVLHSPKEGFVLLPAKRTPKSGKNSLASENAHCLLIKPPPTQLSS